MPGILALVMGAEAGPQLVQASPTGSSNDLKNLLKISGSHFEMSIRPGKLTNADLIIGTRYAFSHEEGTSSVIHFSMMSLNHSPTI